MNAYPLLEDPTVQGPAHDTPCEICGETISVRPNRRNGWYLAPGHIRGVHHQAHMVAERRIAQGWWPLSGALSDAYDVLIRMREQQLANVRVGSRPLADFRVGYEVEGVWSLGYTINEQTLVRYNTASARTELRLILPFYAHVIVETGVLVNAVFRWSEEFLRRHLARLERAQLRRDRHREPWWVAWRLSSFSDQAAIKTGFGLGILLKLSNDPMGYRRGDLTP